MKEYTKPELVVEELLIDDVICASGGYADGVFEDVWGSTEADDVKEW